MANGPNIFQMLLVIKVASSRCSLIFAGWNWYAANRHDAYVTFPLPAMLRHSHDIRSTPVRHSFFVQSSRLVNSLDVT